MDAICIFNRQTQQTLNMSYRTQVWGYDGATDNIYYRINEGPWITIPFISSYIGPTYTSILNITVNVNDKIDYYFAGNPSFFRYSIGFNGIYFGNESSFSTTTIISGTNNIYFNICSQNPDNDLSNISFCFASPS